ncbi:class I SAM-dependent methyltransferase [Myxococcota bacterium]|nr:class I SAM-dependent methyltransferase [Myxococcota bacterium]
MGRTKKSRGKNRGKQRKRQTQASLADKHELYQRAVQEPEADLLLARKIFRTHFGRPPLIMREDFCGTALTACEWVRMGANNRAFGIDLDPDPLEWGRVHNLEKLNEEQQSRVELIEGDVMSTHHEQVDMTLAFNFSYFIFHERATLLEYFRMARASLRPEGLFLMDVYGGSGAQTTSEDDPRDCDGFDYIWDQYRFDPIQCNAVNHIHFEFPDGSRMKRAFTYDWRLWSIPEICDVLRDAGFSQTEVYWEGTDQDTDEGNGIFTLRKSAIDDPAWVAYVAAIP